MSKGHYEIESKIGHVNQAFSEPHSSLNEKTPIVKNKGDENEERGNWTGQFDFILSCLGYAVGLGNVWRFPYLVYENGGGTFLIPYVLFLVFVGIPIFFLELNLGQYTSRGPTKCWEMAPIFGGVGISMAIVSGCLCIYYNVIIAQSLLYFVLSFRKKLLWTDCDAIDNINYNNCYKDMKGLVTPECAVSLTEKNGCCYDENDVIQTCKNFSSLFKNNRPQFPSETFYHKYILEKSDGIENTGGIVWKMALSLLGAWVIVFLCMIKGIKSSGKVVYFTALFPYVVLLILGIRGWMFENAIDGIKFFVKPNLSKLENPKVWNDAAGQIFFSLSSSFGGLITLASYNRFHTNTLRDTMIVSLGNCLTSIFAGFVIFSYIGHLSSISGLPVDRVVKGGSELAFIVYPYAVTTITPAPLWSILFFLMMITLGLDSEFASLEVCLTSILDVFPKLRKYKVFVVMGLCSFFFLLGLPLVTHGGQYWLEIVDKFSGNWVVFVLAICECMALSWVYGWNNWYKDILLMLEEKYNHVGMRIWQVMWGFITPSILLALLIFSWVKTEPLKIGDYVYPLWAVRIGYCLTSFIILVTVLYAVIYMILHRNNIKQCFRPTREWGPALTQHRQLVTHLNPFVVDLDSRKSTELSSKNTKAHSPFNSSHIQHQNDKIRTDY
ncbi:hypothetical protein SNEBB_000950 [Seison nebaliae]|nr:hypothetical protein SNEBB_000950 [Seison nebaliae]